MGSTRALLDGRAALTGPNLAKIDFFRAAQQLRPLR
jgi:hypothetical protein